VENLPCGKNKTVCEANVILAKALEKNRVYQFSLSVRDAQGDQTNVEATLRATAGSSVAALDTAFPRYSTLVMVPEVRILTINYYEIYNHKKYKSSYILHPIISFPKRIIFFCILMDKNSVFINCIGFISITYKASLNKRVFFFK